MFSTIRARNAHGGFSEKILDHSKITKMCYFSRFFGIISKTLLTIFPVFAVNVALNSIFQPAKTVSQNKFSFSRYSSLKVRFGPKMRKWGLKKAQYLENGKCYRKSDLIFGIYGKFSFRYVSSDFCLLVVFRVKI